MDLHALIDLVKAHAPMVVQYILMALGALVVAGFSYVKVTPNQDDDAWLQKLEDKPVIGQILNFLIAFSPIDRNEPPK